MKKIIGLILIVQTILLSMIVLQVYKQFNYLNLLYEDRSTVLLRAGQSRNGENELITYLNENKQGVLISKYSFANDNNLVIYSNDLSINGRINDISNKHSAGYIANYKSNNKQIGKFQFFYPGLKISIHPITDLVNSGIDGLYYIDSSYAEEVIDEINEKNVGSAELYDDFSINVKSCFADIDELSISFLMTLLILCVAVIQYSAKRSKKIAILKTHGKSVFEIVWYLLKEMLIVSLVNIALSTLLTVVIGTIIYGNEYVLTILGIGIIAALISSIFFIFLLSLAIVFVTKKEKAVWMLKGKKPYTIITASNILLKSSFLAFLVIGSITLIQQVNKINILQSNLKIWEKAQNMYGTVLNYVGESRDTEVKLKNFYNQLETMGGILIDGQNFEWADDKKHLYDYNAPGKESLYDPYGKTITVNENYLKNNPVTIDGDERAVFDKIIVEDHTRNILIPKKRQKYEKQIKERFLEDFYFQKVEVENIYNEKQGKAINHLLKENLNINLIYIDDGMEHFPYVNIEEQNGGVIRDSILVLETGNIDTSYYMSYLSRCFFFNCGEEAYNYLIPIIEQTDVKSEVQSTRSVYNDHGQEIHDMVVKRNNLLSALMVLLILFLVVGYLIAASYFQEKKYSIYVKKIFGYHLLQRIYSFVFLSVGIDIAVILIVVMYKKNMIYFLPLIAILLIDAVTIVCESKILDNRNFNEIMKGDR